MPAYSKRSEKESTRQICFTESIPRNLFRNGQRRPENVSGLRGMGHMSWNMAFEQRTDPEAGGSGRLRQVPPVIAERVTDPLRSGPRGLGEEKW